MLYTCSMFLRRQLDQLETKVSSDFSTILSILQDQVRFQQQQQQLPPEQLSSKNNTQYTDTNIPSSSSLKSTPSAAAIPSASSSSSRFHPSKSPHSASTSILPYRTALPAGARPNQQPGAPAADSEPALNRRAPPSRSSSQPSDISQVKRDSTSFRT